MDILSTNIINNYLFVAINFLKLAIPVYTQFDIAYDSVKFEGISTDQAERTVLL